MAVRATAQTYAFTTFAGAPGVAGDVDGIGGAARFSSPQGLAVDTAGNIYVADNGNSKIRKISPAGVVTTLASVRSQFGGAFGPTGPQAVALDAAGNVYASDAGDHVINRISPAGVVEFFAGQQTALGSHGLSYAFELNSPAGLVVDSAGTVFVASGSAIQKISPAGVVTNLPGPVADALAFNRAAQFTGIARDAAGNLYVTDTTNKLVRRITPAGEVATLAGAAGIDGTTDGTGATARFSAPAGIALDAAGNLLVADRAAAVLRAISPSGAVTTVAGNPNQPGNADGVGGFARFNQPHGVVFDAAGNLYVADSANHTIRKGTPTTAVAPPIITVAASSQNQNVGARATVTFTAPASGTALSYQWTKNGAALPGATNATLTLALVTPVDEGAYAVTVSNSAATESRTIGTLRVYPPTLTSFGSRRARAGGSFLWSIATDNSQLVAVGTGGTILTSPDGEAWTTRNSGTTDWLVGVTFGAGKFVAVGDHGRILVSSDGTAWTNAASSGTTQRLNNVVYGDGQFVAVGEAGTIVTSPDAQTWTARDSGLTGWLRGLGFSSRTSYLKYVAGGEGGKIVASTDGVTWEQQPTMANVVAPGGGNITSDLEAVLPVQSYSQFAAIGQDGVAASAIVMFTGVGTDRFNLWYQFQGRPTGASARLRGLAVGANALFATGENGTILTAPNAGGPWAVLPSGTTANLVAGVFFHDALFVVGENETILQSDPLYPGRLVNISTRGFVGAGNPLISGFVVSGTLPKEVLIRTAGPTLGTFGLGGTLANPQLTLFDAEAHPLALSTSWSAMANADAIATTSARVGAFPFAANTHDAAILLELAPGNYTAQVSSADGISSGLGLVEVYDADAPANNGPRTVNISTRGQVGTGANMLIAGFVIGGDSARRVLIRAVGPSLTQFSVTGVLAAPRVQLADNRGFIHLTAAAWSAQANAEEIRAAAKTVGAFALLENSQDAAIVTTLLPGAWTVQVSGAANATGTALVEVYDLP